MLNVDEVREDFPILHQEVNGEELVYVDNAATSQKPRSVIDAISDYYENDNSNVHRGAHKLSERATDAYESARTSVKDFINADSTSEIIFVKNTTEALNLVAYSWAKNNVDEDDEILLTAMEHHSNLIPWQFVAEETGASLEFVELTEDGEIDRDDFSDKLNENTALFAFPHMSNVLGTVNPAQELTREAHEAGALVVVDGAQSMPHMPVDVQAIDCDFLAFSGHKMCGPTGIGGLYGKEELLDEMEPFLGGGEMIGRVERETASWADLPHKFEAGTPSIAQAVGLKAAVEYLNDIGMDNIYEHETELVDEALDRLGAIDDLTIFGHADERGAVVSFEVDGIHPHDLSQVLDEEGVAVRAGHHCAQPLMDWLGVAATTRASFSFYNKKEEIDPIVDGIEQAKEVFSGVPF
jgi:cysteine desulfurase/selenocysteine lyase